MSRSPAAPRLTPSSVVFVDTTIRDDVVYYNVDIYTEEGHTEQKVWTRQFRYSELLDLKDRLKNEIKKFEWGGAGRPEKPAFPEKSGLFTRTDSAHTDQRARVGFTGPPELTGL